MSSSQPGAFVRAARHVYHPLGFRKGYAFTLFFIFGGTLAGFTFSRLQYLAYDRTFCGGSDGSSTDGGAAPGECHYFGRGLPRAGLVLHLATILPASLLVVLQFVPWIRHTFVLFHRLNGYVVAVLALASAVGALISATWAFGGGLDIRAVFGVMVIMHLGSLGMALWNIRKKQIEQHRAWMLRAWVYAGSIITTRVIMIISATIISQMGNFWIARACGVIATVNDDDAETIRDYPQCEGHLSGDAGEDTFVSVQADFSGSGVGAMAALDISFGMATWLALMIHAVGVEIYLHLTPGERDRLREISFQRQRKAGMNNPGSAGLTGEKVGDGGPWVVPHDTSEARV